MNSKSPIRAWKGRLLFPIFLCFFLFQGNIFASHADLELTMTSPNANPGIFANVDIEITITNHGPEATNNVILEFPFPTDLPITGDPVESQGFFSNWWTGTGTWDVGTLASGQTETVTVSLFTLAEDLFFYGQVVNSSVVDNDSTPNNGTIGVPNEDDEAIVAINDTGGGACEVTVLISNIECDDFNTPNLDYDDIFTFDVTVTGQNTSGTWTATLPSVDAFPPTVVTESYGVTRTFAYNIVQANDAFGGIVNFTVQDSNDSSCSEDVSVIVPPSCSPGSGCNIGGSTSNIQCFDGGTPNNSNDDQWSFDLTVNGSNTGANWMAVINGQTYTGNYNQATSLGLFPISGGDVFVALMDSSNPACTDGFTVSAPTPCSNGGNCSISFMGMESVCDDSGTPNDPTDDVWFAELTPQGTGVGATFSIIGDIQAQNLPYGQTYSFGPYPIQPFFERNFTIIDDEDSSCFRDFILGPSATCSGGGLLPDLQPITAQAFLNSNQTMLDLSLTYVNGGDAPAGNNFSVVYLSTDNQVSANDIVLENTYAFTGSLGVNQQTSFGSTVPVPQVAAGSYFVLFSVDDANVVAESDEFDNVGIFPITITGNPGGDADLELSMTSNDQTGAFQFVSYDLTLTNTGTAAATLIDISIPQPTDLVLQGSNPYSATNGVINGFNDVLWSFPSLAPGQTEVLTINYFTLADGNLTCYAEVSGMGNADADSTPGNGTPPTPNEDDEAAFTIGGGQSCLISGALYSNIVCFDNGTPTIIDDYFNFDITITNPSGTSYSMTTNAGVNGVFNYGQTVAITGFPYANLPFDISAVDVNDPSCFSQQSTHAFFPCSVGSDCELTLDSATPTCYDQGTSDSSDDTYSYDIVAFGTGNDAGTGWTTEINGQFFTGFYGIPSLVGPFLINDGPVSITLFDNQDASCQYFANFLPPPPCSNGGGGDTDLKLEVTPSTTFAGTNVVVYTVTLTNEGNNTASGVSMQFYQGASVGITGSTPSTGSYDLSTDIWSVGTIAAGTSETLILNDQFLSFGAASLPTYPFFEILTMDGNDPDSTPGNDNGNETPDEDDEVQLTIFPDGMGGWPSDLSVSLSTPSTTVNLGGTFIINFKVNLDGGAANADILSELLLPAGLQYQSHTTTQGTYNPNTGEWATGYIGGLSDAQLDITVTLIDDSQPAIVFGQILTDSMTDFDSTPGNGACCVANEDDEAVLTINGGNLQRPDLLSITAYAEVNPGGTTFNSTWVIFNNGNANSTPFINRMYFSTDDVLSNNDTQIAGSFVSINSPIAPGDDFDPNLGTLPLPSGTMPGNYYIIFEVDSDNSNDELVESNNLVPFPITVLGGGNGPDLELSISSNSNFQQWDYVSFDITLTNAGTEAATGVEVRLEDIDGGVLQGGNEGSVTAGTFYPVGGAPSHWDLEGVLIGPGQSETLTINCFVLDPSTIQVYAEVIAMNETDPDSTPNNGTPFAPNEDDEASGFVGNSPSPMQLVYDSTNNVESTDYQYFKIQNLYPNPVSNNLKIEIASAVESNANLQIANTQGSAVFNIEKQIHQGRTMVEMDVSTLPRGIYFLKIETEEGMEVQRFLKQ